MPTVGMQLYESTLWRGILRRDKFKSKVEHLSSRSLEKLVVVDSLK